MHIIDLFRTFSNLPRVNTFLVGVIGHLIAHIGCWLVAERHTDLMVVAANSSKVISHIVKYIVWKKKTTRAVTI